MNIENKKINYNLFVIKVLRFDYVVKSMYSKKILLLLYAHKYFTQANPILRDFLGSKRVIRSVERGSTLSLKLCNLTSQSSLALNFSLTLNRLIRYLVYQNNTFQTRFPHFSLCYVSHDKFINDKSLISIGSMIFVS